MSKKKKSRYVDSGTKVVRIGEKITFNKNWEANHMSLEWFYLDDISWYMSADGRIVAPVAGVVRHLGRPRGYVGPSDDFAPKDGCRAMYFSTAEQVVVDVAPFGKCYEKSSLESLWDSLNGHGVERAASMKVNIPEMNDADGREVYSLKDSASGDENVDNKPKHGGVFELTVKEVEDPSEGEKSRENEGEFVNCQKFSEISEEAKSEEAENG